MEKELSDLIFTLSVRHSKASKCIQDTLDTIQFLFLLWHKVKRWDDDLHTQISETASETKIFVIWLSDGLLTMSKQSGWFPTIHSYSFV